MTTDFITVVKGVVTGICFMGCAFWFGWKLASLYERRKQHGRNHEDYPTKAYWEANVSIPSGVWPNKILIDICYVRKEHSIEPHLIVGSKLSAKLDEKIPFTNVKWSECLLNNELVESIVIDILMPENQVIQNEGKKNIGIENIIIQEEN